MVWFHVPIADFVFGRCNPICSADESRVPRYTAGTLRIDVYLQLLLALMALAAITLIATRPFSPQIQFDAIPTSLCDSNNHDIIAGYDMKLTNRGARCRYGLLHPRQLNPFCTRLGLYRERASYCGWSRQEFRNHGQRMSLDTVR